MLKVQTRIRKTFLKSSVCSSRPPHLLQLRSTYCHMIRHVSQMFSSTDTLTLMIAQEKIYLTHSGAETVLLWENSLALSQFSWKCPLMLRNIKSAALISFCKYYIAAVGTVQDVSVAAAVAGKGYWSNIKPPEIATITVGKASVVAALVKKGCRVLSL